MDDIYICVYVQIEDPLPPFSRFLNSHMIPHISADGLHWLWPLFFCTSETMSDLANVIWNYFDCTSPYVIDIVAKFLPNFPNNVHSGFPSKALDASLSEILAYLPPTPRAALLLYVGIHVDGLIYLVQGGHVKWRQIFQKLFTCIYLIFFPDSSDNQMRQEPNWIKMWGGDAAWTTCKFFLG